MITEMKACVKWLEDFETAIQTTNSEQLRSLSTNPIVPAKIKRKTTYLNNIDEDIHKQSSVYKNYGTWIKRCREKMADNRVYSCFVCKNLQYKKNVRKF